MFVSSQHCAVTLSAAFSFLWVKVRMNVGLLLSEGPCSKLQWELFFGRLYTPVQSKIHSSVSCELIRLECVRIFWEVSSNLERLHTHWLRLIPLRSIEKIASSGILYYAKLSIHAFILYCFYQYIMFLSVTSSQVLIQNNHCLFL